jgi:hypothetical protein
VPLQAYDPNAPAVLIRPNISLGETFTDNVNYVHSPRKFAAITQLGGGLTASVDTPRLQAVATGQGSEYFYLPTSSVSTTAYQPSGNLYANAHGTIYPDLLYVDAQSSLTPSTTLPGIGFQNVSTLPRNQQTLQFINNISPYLIKSFGAVADTELRYTFSSGNYGGNTTVTTRPSNPGLNSLTSTTLNEGTFIAATGEDFQKVLARFTADAAQINGSSANQSTQVSAFNDFQYNFTPTIAALGRAGYQNQRYPGSPAATFAGATWLAGGRVGTVGRINRPMSPCNTANSRACMDSPGRPRSMSHPAWFFPRTWSRACRRKASCSHPTFRTRPLPYLDPSSISRPVCQPLFPARVWGCRTVYSANTCSTPASPIHCHRTTIRSLRFIPNSSSFLRPPPLLRRASV